MNVKKLNTLTPRSRTLDAYQRLRSDIVVCRLAPGERLNITELCKLYAVSLGAIRESLSRLASEDLVIAEAQRGFTVAPVSKDDLLDLVRTRIEIETLCLQNSLVHGGVEWEAQLLAAAHRLARTLKNSDPATGHISDEWESAHEAFHFALVSACESHWLLRVRSTLYTQADRYRRFSMMISAARRKVEDEHAELAACAAARDISKLIRLMGDHMNTTARYILDSNCIPDST